MKKKNFKGAFDNLLEGNNTENSFPKKNKEKILEKKYTLLVSEDHIDKVKAIAYMNRKMIKDIFSDALSLYIEDYEKKNGEVLLPKI